MSKIQRALVSVSDKTGLVDFCRELRKQGVEIMEPHAPAQFKSMFLREFGISEKLVQTLGLKLE